MKALITRKVGMTSLTQEDGSVQAVTLLMATANVVAGVKTMDRDGYMAVQLGAEQAKKANKAQTGQFKKLKATPKIIREFHLSSDELPEDLAVGNSINPEVFSVGDQVNVTGTSKGKGWAGTIKRHNFHRGRKTHGGRSYRRPGSIGSMYPQKIFKGKKMAGQMGHERVTTKNLKIALVDQENKVIGVFGSVPGPKKSLVVVQEVKS